jgi:hypothetical protein
MCPKPATTTEHGPPKCFFPEKKDVGVDLRVNLVTVPSCEEHNTSKSNDDQYAMMFVVTHFGTNSLARHQFSTKCIRSLARRPAFTTRVLASPTNVSVDGRSTVAITVERQRFDRVMESTCRALFYNDTQRKLLNQAFVWSPAFRHADLESDPEESALAFHVRRALKDQPKRGQNPDVFWYQVRDNLDGITAFRLMFYEGCSVYAVFSPEQIPIVGPEPT